MDRPGHRLVAHQLDHPPHFAPSAEMDEIAQVAAPVGAQGRLRSGILAETLDQLRRLGEGGGRECSWLKQSFPRIFSLPRLLATRGFETAQGDA